MDTVTQLWSNQAEIQRAIQPPRLSGTERRNSANRNERQPDNPIHCLSIPIQLQQVTKGDHIEETHLYVGDAAYWRYATRLASQCRFL